MSTRNRLAIASAAHLIEVTGAYWYGSPYLAMNSMRPAAEKQEEDAFNQYVDYPKLWYSSTPAEEAPEEVKCAFHPKGLDRDVVRGVQVEATLDSPPGFVLVCCGIANWKLTEFRLPGTK